jgi:inorganic pyrophosphatase
MVKAKNLITIIVETPGGLPQKYDANPYSGYIELNKIMPAGIIFPYDFGYIPNTKGEDGDPLDAMVISETPTFPGCAVKCRIIGAIKALQKERDGATVRNDRFIAIPEVSTVYSKVNKLSQLPAQVVQQLEHFFINYNQQAGKQFDTLARVSAEPALQTILKNQQLNTKPGKLVQFLLPLYDHNGHPFPEKIYTGIKNQLSKKFGGLTAYVRSPAEGIWKKEAREMVKEDMINYEVMTNDIDLVFWKDYQQFLKDQFKQEELLIRYIDMGII